MTKQTEEALEQPAQEVKCNPHPNAPHGFMRDESHSQDRYVCECEYWTPPAQEPVIVAIAQNEPPRVMLQDKINGKYMCFDVDSFVQAHLATEQINGFFNAITPKEKNT